MSVTQLPHSAEADRAVDELPARADVEIVVPVYNEADQLEASITALHSFLHSSFPLVTTITSADNASTDDTCRLPPGWPTPSRVWTRSTSTRKGGVGR